MLFSRTPPPPAPRALRRTALVAPDDPQFSGFVFKIQANMDPKHRDRLAFVRVCSGQFERDMVVTHAQTGEEDAALQFAKTFRAGTGDGGRSVPGDIVGLVGHGELRNRRHADGGPDCSLSTRFRASRRNASPTCTIRIPSKFKQFRKGMDQLLQEGVMQVFYLRDMRSTCAAARRGGASAIRSRAVPVGI